MERKSNLVRRNKKARHTEAEELKEEINDIVNMASFKNSDNGVLVEPEISEKNDDVNLL